MPYYCRLCSRQENAPFDQNLDTLPCSDDMLQILELCLQPVSLSAHENFLYSLPRTVCDTCTDIVKTVQKFVQVCKAAQQKLMRIIAIEMPDLTYDNGAQLPSLTEREGSTENINLKTDQNVECENFVDGAHNRKNREEPEYLQLLILENDDRGRISEDECESRNEKSNSVEMHSGTDQKTHQKTSQRKRICPVCGKLFSNTATLNVHIYTHTQQRDFVCSICNREFYLKQQLKVHMESIHEKKDFICNKCGLKCRWRKSLRRHMQLHEENPYKHKCTYCEKAFARPNQLRHHVMKHTGEGVICDICGANYRYNYMLTQHKIREHGIVVEGVKLYKENLKKKKMSKSISNL